ncbi:sigma-70 family RNA polymerase sigma factor [Mycobacterium sp. SMC-4]|uniref:sigma-70 family RNA polymerase sigma factor n=1 Tax=Mycobacterium sp. SMC-4 TaxID=2857059 RepID=UPI0021B303AC|nr:sigma-70 family RNA polymerase sigma factor [Mycobacterium sp. SMC-4]UXA16990.1 sigma-70 family RNA polymerase sigma factor [Mycobacterium sp. SMC-4]
MISTAEFEEARPMLLAVAYRMVGSAHDAEDAVQTAWLRAQSSYGAAVANPAAWLTTVVSRVCLDQLRDRQRRNTLTRNVNRDVDTVAAADEDMLRREDVSRALLVLLNGLTPAQRVAFVLHDLFAIPFDDIAEVLGTSPSAAKKHASRARARIRPGPPDRLPDIEDAQHRTIVDAFLQAARGGDLDRMIALLAPDCVRRVDPALLPDGTPGTVTGSAAVATETRSYLARIRVSTTLRVNGCVVDVIAPGGHPWAVIQVRTADGLITEIMIRPVRHTDRFAALPTEDR